MHRVKRVDYDEDDLYDEEDDAEEYGEGEGGEDGTTAEDRENFATLTPVVRAELEESGLQVTEKEIQDALWHYYWDVGKSVAYLKNSRTARDQSGAAAKKDVKKESNKPKSKFDQAAEKSAKIAGEHDFSLFHRLPSGSVLGIVGPGGQGRSNGLGDARCGRGG